MSYVHVCCVHLFSTVNGTPTVALSRAEKIIKYLSFIVIKHLKVKSACKSVLRVPL